ncbi:hypothetical protein (plasmid) [Citrobacter freundii]|uniref:Uncharacterized protein n=3 Tax=Enterobacteriaceae TaxID=543 RepID=A0A7M1HY99_ECOLX|nr:hypothetical protein [Enterobacter cloacae]AVE24435.1 hypothetical protein [Citrobacter freundii]EII35490.1 hypothetical protein EC40967_A0100 [Escherichia coli 4.0967]QMV82027.1 hypothetical protein [Leclercia sp.]QOQ31101.1 hypothetical protein [Escherichia coli]QZX58645.1 hypothetical protein [Klebsiella michiganensis]WJR85875.1 hypothetical protein [Enterobacter hormaechei subsp. steigerwaltii]
MFVLRNVNLFTRGKAVPSMRAQRAGVSSRSLEVIDSGRPIPMTFSRMAN